MTEPSAREERSLIVLESCSVLGEEKQPNEQETE